MACRGRSQLHRCCLSITAAVNSGTDPNRGDDLPLHTVDTDNCAGGRFPSLGNKPGKWKPSSSANEKPSIMLPELTFLQ